MPYMSYQEKEKSSKIFNVLVSDETWRQQGKENTALIIILSLLLIASVIFFFALKSLGVNPLIAVYFALITGPLAYLRWHFYIKRR